MKDNAKFKGLRNHLIDNLRKKGIKSENILGAMGKIPRHYFMDPGLIDFAYEDQAYPIAAEQTISQPYTCLLYTSPSPRD